MGFPKGASIPFGRERGSNPGRELNRSGNFPTAGTLRLAEFLRRWTSAFCASNFP
jgi:hypothetical protein